MKTKVSLKYFVNDCSFSSTITIFSEGLSSSFKTILFSLKIKLETSKKMLSENLPSSILFHIYVSLALLKKL